ncbi:PREDICTED: cyclin-dependent protein kinase inhibitor SMR3-like [Camelina sativa]|uniref:Cyclin-dependent protein kinase inhibitor SMR3-like n=1 Tax=Camelina sativa TaxID=90675 RepID=A0ABM0U501_CAMSA|nr:PREDICTED: cyclin-dependent protein kinase inhibitor SMR3-like [Camelina sativa]
MGFSKKSQFDGGLESDRKKWVIAGISIRATLKPVKTKQLRAPPEIEAEVEEDCYKEEEEECLTTPTAKEAKIPEILKCPPAPRKRRPVSKCRSNAVREFFTPPSDLEAVFIRRR